MPSSRLYGTSYTLAREIAREVSRDVERSVAPRSCACAEASMRPVDTRSNGSQNYDLKIDLFPDIGYYFKLIM